VHFPLAGVHFSEDPGLQHQLHVLVPAVLSTIQEHSKSKDFTSPIDKGTLAVARTLIRLAYERTRARLALNSSILGLSDSQGLDGPYASEARDEPSSDDNEPGQRDEPVSDGGPERSEAKGGGPGSSGAGRRQVFMSSNCCDLMEEAMIEQRTTRALLEALQLPRMHESLGLSSAPTALHTLTVSSYADSFHFMVPDGNGGWDPSPLKAFS
jgi:hypothetical protein